MDPHDILTTMAEIAIALAGFSGIVAVLGRHASGSWSEEDRLRLGILLQTSFGAVCWSLAPLLLFSAEASPQLTWLLTSGGYAAYLTGSMAYRVYRVRAVARAHPEIPIDRGYAALMFFGGFAVVALAVANAWSLQTLWPHAVCVLFSLIVGFIQFVRLLRSSWSS